MIDKKVIPPRTPVSFVPERERHPAGPDNGGPGRGGPRHKPSKARRIAKYAALALVLMLTSFAGFAVWALHDLPFAGALDPERKPVLVLVDSDGNLLTRRGPFRSAPVTREDIPDHLVDALVAIEDRRFYRHWGIDPYGIVRATVRNTLAGRVVEGASTITQQLVRYDFLENERTMLRKVREAALAVWLEMHASKDEILVRYLNTLYFGSGAHGITAAAHHYFGKKVPDLTLEESAMLVGLVNAPAALNPRHDLAAARGRAVVVVDAMAASGRIDEAGAAAAKAKLAALEPVPAPTGGGSWFADWANLQAETVAPYFAGSGIGALRVRTTLRPDLQELAEQAISTTLAESGEVADGLEVALVALAPDGAVLAMVGGRSYEDSQFNRAVQSLRQPGSTFKLFVYFAALRNGLTLDQMIEDGPIEVNGWEPENFGGRFHGTVTLAEAFTHSYNAAAARLGQVVGIDEVARAARDLGIDAELSETPSLALGASGVSLLDLTGAYASVRSGLMPTEPWGISDLGSMDGERALTSAAPSRQRERMGPHRAELVRLLNRALERGTGRAARIDDIVAAGKTGTSQEHRDAWFVGFTDRFVVGVWVGNDDNSPTDGITGGDVPARIWRNFVGAAHGILNDAAEPLTVSDNRDAPASCDIDACSDAYRSFRASDCTYQPYSGPRRKCTKGEPDVQVVDLGEVRFSERDSDEDRLPERDRDEDRLPEPTRDEGRVERRTVAAGAVCDVNACASRYNSFRASDCTYQPYGGGPRQLCGMGAAPDEGRQPRQREPDSPRYRTADARSGIWAPPPPPQSGRCNFNACAATYNSFRPSDCTYQPYGGGPRALCTK